MQDQTTLSFSVDVEKIWYFARVATSPIEVQRAASDYLNAQGFKYVSNSTSGTYHHLVRERRGRIWPACNHGPTHRGPVEFFTSPPGGKRQCRWCHLADCEMVE